MRFLWLTSLSVMSSLSFAQTQVITNGREVESMSDLDITKVLPAEYAAYRSALTKDGGVRDAQAALLLLSETRKRLDEARPSVERKREDFNAYHAAWRLCLRHRCESHDPAARQLILDQWNQSLKSNGDAVCSQLYALRDVWDRDLLTDACWQLLRETKNPHTIVAFCALLHANGDETDVDRLAAKRDSEIDVPTRKTIQNSIIWLRYRLTGGPTHAGPAALPPAAESPPFDHK